MINTRTRAFASPGKYIQGPKELNNLKNLTHMFGDNVVVVIDPFLYDALIFQLEDQYNDDNNIRYIRSGSECTMTEINRIELEAEQISPDVIVGIGGGKTLDQSKAVADKLSSHLIVVPTSASNDASTSALSVIYTDTGVHCDTLYYKRHPDIVLVDTDIIVNAPSRLLVAGMGDALATYFEALANDQSDSANYIGKGYRRTKLALMIAELCYKTLLEKGALAKNAIDNKCRTEALEDIIEVNTLLSGLGFENTGCAAAHGIHVGLSELPETLNFYHGEKVAFGTICQLILENQTCLLIDEVINFCLSVGLPVTLEEVGVIATNENIKRIAEHALDQMSSEPFIVTVDMLFHAIKAADSLGKFVMDKNNPKYNASRK